MKFLPAIIGSIAVWCLISAQQPVAAEGYSSALSGINWVKVLGALVPIVVSVLQGGKFDWKSIVSTLLGIKFDPTPTPPPVPVPTPDDDRPVLSLLRRLIDMLVSDGRFSEANDVMELYKSCCERPPVEAKR